MTILKLVAVIGFALLFILIFPFAVIGSLNTLFGLNIPTNFDAWCSVIVLMMAVSAFRK
jgi:hypothetical protein